MSKCPYCQVDLSIEDFFVVLERTTKRGKIKKNFKEFRGGILISGHHGTKMWVCPGCDTILGFSEFDSDRSMS